MPLNSSYRPHNPGHDYYDKGIYLITLVVSERNRLLGELNMSPQAPAVMLTELGRTIMQEWERVSNLQAQKGHEVRLLAAICMPDHFHAVIEIPHRLDISLGDIIWGFKVACTQRYRTHIAAINTAANNGNSNQPDCNQFGVSSGQHWGATLPNSRPFLAEKGWPLLPDGSPDLHRMSRNQRREYYDSRPRTERPLFDDNYDDTICLDQRHRDAMLRYVQDNPRRAILMKCNPTFMQRLLHIQIAGKASDGSLIWRDYAAFGNLFLLRWAQKLQVFCHRSAIVNGQRIPFEQTQDYQRQHDEWMAQAQKGATVLVTPGISKGESTIKTECIERGIPLIHLQAEPIHRYWKPELNRFNACQNGTLLILAPWNPEAMGDVNGVPQNTQYAIFHNMNTLAADICNFDGEAKIIADQ